MCPDRPVTQLLRESRAGSAEATNRLIPIVYEHLRALAGHYMRGERSNHTLTPTALLNEAYLKLVGRISNGKTGLTSCVLRRGPCARFWWIMPRAATA